VYPNQGGSGTLAGSGVLAGYGVLSGYGVLAGSGYTTKMRNQSIFSILKKYI
jgi:hypothetical protein